MQLTIIILLALAVVVLVWRFLRIRAILSDLADAVSSKSTYLPEAPSRTIFRKQIERLTEEFTALKEQEQKMRALEFVQKNQIDAVLEKIQEAVYSIDQNNRIIHANKTACNIFNKGNSIKGHRFEEFIRNPDFLDCAHFAKNGKPQTNREISVLIENKHHWFEVSATPIPKSVRDPYGSVMFVFHDITRLKELEIVKNNFVANVSHELKTPITIIKGFTETLIDDNTDMPPETRLKFLKKIESNSERLNLIVMDLLTLSRMESEPEFIKKTPTTIISLLSNVLENHLPIKKQEQTLKLEHSIPEGTIFNLDDFRISQLFQCLIENAIRYSGEDTTITLKAEIHKDTGDLVCSVNDNGKGIPESDVSQIFRRFYRVDRARSRINGGTGLGLSIARGIVEHHNGTIIAKNIQDGGLSIEFTIPTD